MRISVIRNNSKSPTLRNLATESVRLQAYIEYAEKEYLEATITLKDILFNSKNANQKVSKDHLIEQFEEAMQ